MLRWACLAAGLALVAPTAAAEQSDTEAEAFREFERGRRYFDAEDYLAAAEHFEAAYRLMPSASVHFNIARSYELAREPGLAAERYRAFLEGRAGSPSRRRRARESLDVLSEGLGWVDVVTDPEGAEVQVGPRARGVAPVALALVPGRHRVVATADDRRGEATLEVEAGGQYEVTLDLVGGEPEGPEGPTPPVAFGGDPDVDPEPIDGPPRGEGGGGLARLHHGWFWGLLGLTLASGGALAGVGTGMLSLSEEYNGLRSRDDLTSAEVARRDELFDFGPSWERATTALWVSTGVLAAATVLVAVFTDWSTLGGGGSAHSGPLIGWMPRVSRAAAAAAP